VVAFHFYSIFRCTEAVVSAEESVSVSMSDDSRREQGCLHVHAGREGGVHSMESREMCEVYLNLLPFMFTFSIAFQFTTFV